jgi:hypothetical protein
LAGLLIEKIDWDGVARTRDITFREKVAHAVGQFAPHRQSKGRREETGEGTRITTPAGRVPGIARIMTFAVLFDDLMRHGKVKSYVELAHLTQVSRSRLSQVMGLLDLAPAIQEAILALPPFTAKGDPVNERALRNVVNAVGWSGQKQSFRTC